VGGGFIVVCRCGSMCNNIKVHTRGCRKVVKTSWQVLVKPSLHNNIITVADYSYNYVAKQHASALLGHHQAYKTVVLVKVHSMVFTYGIPCFINFSVIWNDLFGEALLVKENICVTWHPIGKNHRMYLD